MRSDSEFQPSYAIFQDWPANRGNPKGRLIMAFFRVAYYLRNSSRITAILGAPVLILYRLTIEWILGVEIPHKTKIGPGLQIHHGPALVIHDSAIIGQGCVLRHSTTLGNKKLPDGSYSPAPQLGDFVDVGVGALIIGPISIGDHAIIGAGSVVTKDVPARTIVAGNPARTIRLRDDV